MEYKKYNLEHRDLVFVGDIHGEFNNLANILRKHKDSAIFVCGDIGVGFPDSLTSHMVRWVNKRLDPIAVENNLHVLLVRGNHDNPDYFNNEIQAKMIGTDRIRFVSDYTEFTIHSKEFESYTKVLCVGGGLSIDKMRRAPNISYWSKEMPFLKRIEELSNPDILCTHTCADGVFERPQHKAINTFVAGSLMRRDLEEESDTIRKVWEYYKPKHWYHGHFHMSHKTVLEETTIVGLSICENVVHSPAIKEENKKQKNGNKKV